MMSFLEATEKDKMTTMMSQSLINRHSLEWEINVRRHAEIRGNNFTGIYYEEAVCWIIRMSFGSCGRIFISIVISHTWNCNMLCCVAWGIGMICVDIFYLCFLIWHSYIFSSLAKTALFLALMVALLYFVVALMQSFNWGFYNDMTLQTAVYSRVLVVCFKNGINTRLKQSIGILRDIDKWWKSH